MWFTRPPHALTAAARGIPTRAQAKAKALNRHFWRAFAQSARRTLIASSIPRRQSRRS
ncbi:protein of unknown function [Methylocella tundrae]|uniref:Uncharacterized protein n=1 Tax=Methylocella tundrae TaxID=227605 RepID=A0A4U8Z3R7_METTU|nr:protein of unknown function [Methylocella tundrae]